MLIGVEQDRVSSPLHVELSFPLANDIFEQSKIMQNAFINKFILEAYSILKMRQVRSAGKLPGQGLQS